MISAKPNSRLGPLDQLVAGTVELHRLIAAGLCDSDEADAVRDEMDGPWVRATDSERKIVDGLSADLNGLTMPPNPAVGTTDANVKRYRSADADGRWFDAIDAIRDEEPRLPPGLANLLRGVCWSHAGFPEAGEVFFDAAASVETPAEWRLPSCRIANLLHQQKVSQAAELAQLAIKRSNDPDTLRLACQALAAHADELAGEESANLHRQAIALGESLLARAGPNEANDADRAQTISVMLALALSHIALGQQQRALEIGQQATSLDPNCADAKLLHAWLTRDQSPAAANAEFGKSLRAGLQFPPVLPDVQSLFPEPILNP